MGRILQTHPANVKPFFSQAPISAFGPGIDHPRAGVVQVAAPWRLRRRAHRLRHAGFAVGIRGCARDALEDRPGQGIVGRVVGTNGGAQRMDQRVLLLDASRNAQTARAALQVLAELRGERFGSRAAEEPAQFVFPWAGAVGHGGPPERGVHTDLRAGGGSLTEKWLTR
jgi:hypothetical protein